VPAKQQRIAHQLQVLRHHPEVALYQPAPRGLPNPTTQSVVLPFNSPPGGLRGVRPAFYLHQPVLRIPRVVPPTISGHVTVKVVAERFGCPGDKYISSDRRLACGGHRYLLPYWRSGVVHTQFAAEVLALPRGHLSIYIHRIGRQGKPHDVHKTRHSPLWVLVQHFDDAEVLPHDPTFLPN